LETKVDVGLWVSGGFWLELHVVEGVGGGDDFGAGGAEEEVARAEEAVEFGDEGGGEEAEQALAER
jgi:hypothetical protein